MILEEFDGDTKLFRESVDEISNDFISRCSDGPDVWFTFDLGMVFGWGAVDEVFPFCAQGNMLACYAFTDFDFRGFSLFFLCFEEKIGFSDPA